MIKQRWKIFSAVLFLTFGGVTSANADAMKIALSVTMQEPTVPIPGGNQYPTTKIRITEKDVLAQLASFYSFPSNSYLSYDNSVIYIRDANGNILHTVSSTYLAMDFPGTSIFKGVWGAGLQSAKYTTWSRITFGMAIDSGNNFDLEGLYENKVVLVGAMVNHNLKATLLGEGKYQGKNCIVSGTLKIKYAVPFI